jgi:hypothetical protein
MEIAYSGWQVLAGLMVEQLQLRVFSGQETILEDPVMWVLSLHFFSKLINCTTVRRSSKVIYGQGYL